MVSQELGQLDRLEPGQPAGLQDRRHEAAARLDQLPRRHHVDAAVRRSVPGHPRVDRDHEQYRPNQQLGTPEEIYERPANVFVAGFVGSPAMNFVEGHVSTDDGKTVIRGETWELPLSPAKAAKARNTREVIVGVRHGHVRVLPDSAGAGLPGRLYTVEPTGDITFVHVQLGTAFLVASTTEPF